MSKPHSGIWIGTFLFDQTNHAVAVTLNLTVHNDGRLTGEFTVKVPAGGVWTGPLDGKFEEGNYSPFGTLHIEEEAQASEKGSATFDGRFEAPQHDCGVMWGTVLIRKDSLTQKGTMALIYTTLSETQLKKTPTGGAFPDRVWDG